MDQRGLADDARGGPFDVSVASKLGEGSLLMCLSAPTKTGLVKIASRFVLREDLAYAQHAHLESAR